MTGGRRGTVLFGLNLFLGLSAVLGGVSMLVGLIKVPLSALAESAFSDYTVPALLLLLGVGGPSLLAAWFVRFRSSLGAPASMIAGGSILIFETVEWNVIGFSFLLAIYLGIGTTIILLAMRGKLADHRVRRTLHRSGDRA